MEVPLGSEPRAEAWRRLCDLWSPAPWARVSEGPPAAAATRMVVPQEAPVLGLDWSPDGRFVAAAGGGRTPGAPGAVRVVDVGSGRTVDCRGHDAGAFSVAFEPRHGWLASAGHDGRVLLWDLASGGCLALVRAGVSRHVLAFYGAWLAVGDELAQQGAEAGVRLVDLTSADTVFRYALGNERFAHSLDLAGGLLVVAEVHRELAVSLAAWDVPAGRLRWRVPVQADLLHAVRIAGDVVESVTDRRGDRRIRRRDPENGAILAEVVAGGSVMGALAVDRPRNRLASAGSDGRIAVLALPGLAEEGHIDGIDPAMALAWSPDGSRLAVGSAYGTVQIVPVPRP